ncbi:hypothetical protein BD309DRAFT_864696, partial [Dichomitus squalens]
HTSHLPVSDGGRSQPSRGLGFESGCSSSQYELFVVKVHICLGAHDPLGHMARENCDRIPLSSVVIVWWPLFPD